jgi:hypothetical protein
MASVEKVLTMAGGPLATLRWNTAWPEAGIVVLREDAGICRARRVEEGPSSGRDVRQEYRRPLRNAALELHSAYCK